MSRTLPFAVALFGLIAASAAQAQPRIKAHVTPPVRVVDSETDKVTYRLRVRPGVPKAGETGFFELSIAEKLEKPDATYGRRKPINDGELTAVLTAQVEAKKKKKAVGWSEARSAFKLRDAGVYGFTFTPPTAGLYGLHISGSSPAGNVEFSTVVAVEVWPIPEDAQTPPLPDKVPEATVGNRTNGRMLCEEKCEKNVAGALPAGGTPIFLPSGFAAGKSDAELLEAMFGNKVRSLSEMEKLDAVFFLRSLHTTMTEFFPETAVYTSSRFTINEHGIERLAETAKLKLSDEELSGTVFIVYKGDKNGKPALINYENRVARDRLKKDDKIGYVIFTTIPGDKRALELGIGLAREPTYHITKIIARSGDGKRDAALNKQLASFIGQGSFNDARSLRKGHKSLQGKLLPIYLRAAELATAYYTEEREFTAFDDEFK